MSEHSIFIKGARVNNLKNIDVEIPRDYLGRENHRWLSILYMPRDNVVM